MSHDNERPEGRYANYFEIGHNAFEFLVDFGQSYTDSDSILMHTRVITGPGYAKALLTTLQDAIDEFEKVYGSITEDSKRQSKN